MNKILYSERYAEILGTLPISACFTGGQLKPNINVIHLIQTDMKRKLLLIFFADFFFQETFTKIFLTLARMMLKSVISAALNQFQSASAEQAP